MHSTDEHIDSDYIQKENDSVSGLEINHRLVSADALEQIIQSYVQREGTDYGEQEYSQATKVAQVLASLDQGKARLNFDSESQSINIVPVE